MSPHPPTPSRCPSGITSLFLHYIFTTGKYWESNWILPSFLSEESETKDSEKPDSLRFVREAQFERFRNGLITPRSLVLLLYKGAGRKKAPFQVPQGSGAQVRTEGLQVTPCGAALLGQPRKEWAEQDSNLRLLPCKRIHGLSMEYPGEYPVIFSL